MLLFIPRSLCALKRVAAKAEHARYGATQGIRITLASGLYRAEATDGRRAVIVQGLVPIEDPLWPGFKEVPDDACEAVVLPKDLERACKVGDQFVQSRFDMVGMATSGADIYLGLGNDIINMRTVEGRFPMIDQVMPKKRPMFTFRIDPKLMAETLLAMADLLPDTDSPAAKRIPLGELEPMFRLNSMAHSRGTTQSRGLRAIWQCLILRLGTPDPSQSPEQDGAVLTA